MNPWLDAIDKLRLLGYSVNLDGGKLRYTYQDKGNPSQKEITPLLEVLKAHKAEILKDPCFLIEQTIQAINEHWKLGTFGRLSPEVWERVKTIEREIDRSTLAKDIDGLRKALEEYKGIFLANQQPSPQFQGELHLGVKG
jgi:hypothetical protein